VSDLQHPLFARLFTALCPQLEREVGPWRRRLLAATAGEVLELGAGNGANFPYYPKAVERVVAVEPEPYLRRQAQRRAQEAPVPIEVVAGRAEELPESLGRFDCAVATLVFCSIADPNAALRAVASRLKEGGTLYFLEHVRGRGTKAAAQLLLDRSRLWPLVAGGCHCSRDLRTLLEASPFSVEEVEEVAIGPGWLHVNPHLVGRARLAR